MVPGFLRNPEVRRWLGGVEPAWTLLDDASFHALRGPPHPQHGPLRLTSDLTADEIEQSAVARNTLLLLRAAAGSGLKLTATGNLARSVVAEMMERFVWPDFDRTHEFRLHKVVNEPDFLPLFFVRHVAMAARLLRKHKDYLRLTPSGMRLLEPTNVRAAQAILLHTALWGLDFGYFGRSLHGNWPLQDCGVVLWSLSVAADAWQTRERLTRLCTVPIVGVLDTREWDSGAMAMEAKVLRPLRWFGMLEYWRDDRGGPSEAGHLYRRTPLFDRTIAFNVALAVQTGARH